MNNPLAKDFTFSSLLHFAFPTIVMMLFMGLYTIVDTIFVSQFVNTFALSALNIVCPVINIIVGIGTMIATGGSAIIARQMGAGKMTEAHQNFTIIFVLTILLGLIITLVGLFFIENIIWGLGASPLLFPYCKDYLLIIFIFSQSITSLIPESYCDCRKTKIWIFSFYQCWDDKYYFRLCFYCCF